MKKPKIIIWGYKHPNHTQHYLHWGWYNTFKYLEYETYWFTDEENPEDFNYNDSIFITEGYADNKIPSNKSSVYFVNLLTNPSKYINEDCRVIDIRLNVDQINDCNYNFTLDRSLIEKIGNCAYYDGNASDSFLGDKFKKGANGYEALYLSWATHLLPNEINLEDANIKRDRTIYWSGTIGEGNINEVVGFRNTLLKEGIGFVHRDPWSNPTSWDELKSLTQKSFMAPDLRGSAFRSIQNGKPDTGVNHKLIGYIPCRTFKNISFGQLGITNSKAVYELFDGNIIYNDNESEIFYDALPFIENTDMIKNQMNYVKENHTFVDRIQSIMRVYNKK